MGGYTSTTDNDEQQVPEPHPHDLDHELACPLRERRRAEPAPVPLAQPPRRVRLLVLELAQKEAGDEAFLECTLDEDDRDETEYGVRDIPELQEPLHSKSQ